MFQQSKEYSLGELIEHPVLGVQMATEGIERRCLELMLDLASGRHRFAGTEDGEGVRRFASGSNSLFGD